MPLLGRSFQIRRCLQWLVGCEIKLLRRLLWNPWPSFNIQPASAFNRHEYKSHLIKWIFTRIIFGNSTEQQVVMTSAISIFAILMVVIINLSTNSGAISKAKPHQNLELRKFRSFSKSGTSKKGKFSANNRHMSVKNGRNSDKKGQKKSSKKNQKMRKPKGQKKLPKKHEKSAMKGQRQNFVHCDYIDLHELGHRGCSDFDCKPGGKFLVKVSVFLPNWVFTCEIHMLCHRLHVGFGVSFWWQTIVT